MRSRFISVVSAISDAEAGTVSVLVTDDGGELHQLEFVVGALGALVLSIMAQIKLLHDRDERIVPEFQTMALTQARVVDSADGRGNLLLTFENAIEIAASLSWNAWEQLRVELNAVGIDLGDQ